MDGVKRAEMFENLRRANNEISVAKKLQILHSTPQVVGMKKQSVSSRNPPGQYATEGRAHSYNMNSTYDSMKPPSLKQLRMELIQRQIIDKTRAGMPIGAQAIDASNIIMRGPEGGPRGGIFDTSKRLGNNSKTAFTPGTKGDGSSG